MSGEKIKVVAAVNPDYATNREVKWERRNSTSPYVIMLTPNGINATVHAHTPGKAKIVATITEWRGRGGYTFTDTCDVTVVPVKQPIELLTTAQVAEIQTERSTQELVDLWTGKSFNISWAASTNYHTDWNPATPADTAVYLSIVASAGSVDWNQPTAPAWLWNGRPGVLKLNGRLIAVGFHLYPHEIILGGNPGLPFKNIPKDNSRDVNGTQLVGGHMCMYYGDSPGGNPPKNSCNDMAREAHKLGL